MGKSLLSFDQSQWSELFYSRQLDGDVYISPSNGFLPSTRIISWQPSSTVSMVTFEEEIFAKILHIANEYSVGEMAMPILISGNFFCNNCKQKFTKEKEMFKKHCNLFKNLWRLRIQQNLCKQFI